MSETKLGSFQGNSQKMTCYIACEENLLRRVQNYVNKSQRAVNFLCNTALLPSDAIDFFAMLPTQRLMGNIL